MPVWIGIVKTNGNWAWSDRSPLTFNRFAQTKDLVGKTREQMLKHDCGTIGHNKHGYGRRWYSRPCDEDHKFVCRK